PPSRAALFPYTTLFRSDLMEQQCRKFHPALAVVSTPELAAELRAQLSDLPEIEIQHGEAGLLAAASLPQADTVITAVVGMLGLRSEEHTSELQSRFDLV